MIRNFHQILKFEYFIDSVRFLKRSDGFRIIYKRLNVPSSFFVVYADTDFVFSYDRRLMFDIILKFV